MTIKTVSGDRMVPTKSEHEVNVPKKQRLSPADMLKRITKDNLHSEVDWGAPRGNEVW
jgi:antitoxin component of MazEF toxin-antitoxin module